MIAQEDNCTGAAIRAVYVNLIALLRARAEQTMLIKVASVAKSRQKLKAAGASLRTARKVHWGCLTTVNPPGPDNPPDRENGRKKTPLDNAFSPASRFNSGSHGRGRRSPGPPVEKATSRENPGHRNGRETPRAGERP